ncbi:PREDICTED: uncharacterized protein LOC108779731 [Cyphomyrmex costatus]|uniref:uncharacterized protein LOC108779731 n=1 Tax=Cyphomyrmex costatus TaxID=456900 RepID=UPI0008523F9B|nr:PREDICTED: uncharacterized protein LOC108779731 [Cyphomyrmex costatus]
MKMRSHFYNSKLIHSIMWMSTTYLLFILSLSTTTTAKPAVDGIGLTLNINKAYSHFNRIGKQQSLCAIDCIREDFCLMTCSLLCQCQDICIAVTCSNPEYPTCMTQPPNSTCNILPCIITGSCTSG